MSDEGCDIGKFCGLESLCCCKNECETNDEEKPLIVQVQPRKAKDSSKNSLRESNRKKRKTVTELEEKKERLRKRASTLLKVDPEDPRTRVDCNYKEIGGLKERREVREQSDPQKADSKTQCSTVLDDDLSFQKVYGKIIDIMIGKMIEECVSPLLKCSEGQGQSYVNQKEQYKIYGLLLSAIGKDIRTKKEPNEILQKAKKSVSGLSLDLNKEATIRNVTSSIELTHSMLILLPPLLLIQPKRQRDDVQDTNRKTWDDSEEQREQLPLIYYRPVLVHGNQLNVGHLNVGHLNVAVRGLVGNINTTDLL